jgi:hypothetical protein
VVSTSDVRTLRGMEERIDRVISAMNAGWRDGECIVAHKVSPDRAAVLADKIALVRSDLGNDGKRVEQRGRSGHDRAGELRCIMADQKAYPLGDYTPPSPKVAGNTKAALRELLPALLAAEKKLAADTITVDTLAVKVTIAQCIAVSEDYLRRRSA